MHPQVRCLNVYLILAFCSSNYTVSNLSTPMPSPSSSVKVTTSKYSHAVSSRFTINSTSTAIDITGSSTITTPPIYSSVSSIHESSSYHSPSTLPEPSGMFTSNRVSSGITGHYSTPTMPLMSTHVMTSSPKSNSSDDRKDTPSLVAAVTVVIAVILITVTVVIVLAIYFTARRLKRSKGVAAPTPRAPGTCLSDYPRASVSSESTQWGYHNPVYSGMFQ